MPVSAANGKAALPIGVTDKQVQRDNSLCGIVTVGVLHRSTVEVDSRLFAMRCQFAGEGLNHPDFSASDRRILIKCFGKGFLFYKLKRGFDRDALHLGCDEEIAFYDALADNESARDVMGDDKLRMIAHELLDKVKATTGVDWQRSENARARIRVMVKRILRKHGYPPDMQDAAVRLVLEQAEALSAVWAA